MDPEEITSAAGEPVMIEGKPVAATKVFPLTEIIHRGELLELQAKRDLMTYASRMGADIVPAGITVRWALEVNATAWPRPDFVVGAFVEVEHELDERRQVVRLTMNARGESFDATHKAMYELEPDPELVQLAEEAESTWQGAIARAVHQAGYAVRFSPPSEKVWTL